ncbi:NAD+-dependent protein deacetylase SIR2 [Entomortierella parvispora]|uniref:NAD+-dependent protein deacetylase SIR2 n=1 Tax=Entomortierella parvispora TaxID=205924 RepID=A0A9P3HB36_9FUNG|nr:NAD+-dependent protein deacetylase SIR2 [Entomortierella parvispora]
MSQRPLDVSTHADASRPQAHSVSALPAQEEDRSLHSSDTTRTTVDENRSLQVPLDVSTSRPDSPVNKKRTDDHDAEILDHDGVSGHHPSLPPSKKSKTSPVLQPQNDSMMTAFKDADANIRRQTAGSFVDATRVANPSNSNPDMHSGVSGADYPVLRHSATAILESLSKPGENSLGNLNLGTPTPTSPHDHTGDRVMGVITSRPGSRQASPHLDTTDPAESRSPPTGAMIISSDEEAPQHSSIAEVLMQEDVREVKEPDQTFEQAYGSDSDAYDSDSMDDIDVEYHGMVDSDVESEGSPYEDPDPLCLDRLTDEETEVIMDEARVHGISYIIQKYILSGLMSAKKMLLMTIPGQKIEIPEGFTENDVIRAMQQQLKRFIRRRKRLEHIHSLEAVVDLLKTSKKIMVLTGAGVSVSCGIPDFRSEDGIYSRLSEFELDDPQQMFDLDFFRERPEIFYSFAREIFPSNFVPSPSHYFIKLLEDKGKLLRNYAQNIDALEQQAGIERVLQCHGSFATASCVRCGFQVKGDDIKESIFKQEVAYCTRCKKPTPPPRKNKPKGRYSSSDEDESEDEDRHPALMKPDIVFFGEKLPPVFDQRLKEDKQEVDLLIVIGSSLKVAPVSDIMHQLPNSVPQILINRTPNYQMAFDVQLLGNCDTIVAELCRMAGWELKHQKLPGGTSNVPDMETNTNADGSGTGGRAAWSFMEPNTYLFEGALLEELDFEAVKEKSRNRALVEQEPGSNDEEQEDEDDHENDDAAPLDAEGVAEHHDDDNAEESDSEIESGNISSALSAHLSVSQLQGELSVVGIASGTTLPRSGSITDIHQLHSSGSSGSSGSSDFGDLTNPSAHLTEATVRHSTGDSGLLKQIHFTESMPRDIDESLVRNKNGDGVGQLLDPAHVLQHSRRPSADLCPITEDTVLEVDDDEDDDDELAGKEKKSRVLST